MWKAKLLVSILVSFLIMQPKVDPLARVRDAAATGKIPSAIMKKLEDKSEGLSEAVSKVEKASGLAYPPYYIQPVLILVKSSLEVGETGVYYARNVPVALNNRLHLLVEFTAPLVLYASKKTLQGVVAHEFTHYLELVRRFADQPFSSATATTMFEATYKDMEEAMPAYKIFGRHKSLIRMVETMFENGFNDATLNDKTVRNWFEKKLPYVVVRPDENFVRMPVEAIVNAEFDPAVLRKIREIGE